MDSPSCTHRSWPMLSLVWSLSATFSMAPFFPIGAGQTGSLQTPWSWSPPEHKFLLLLPDNHMNARHTHRHTLRKTWRTRHSGGQSASPSQGCLRFSSTACVNFKSAFPLGKSCPGRIKASFFTKASFLGQSFHLMQNPSHGPLWEVYSQKPDLQTPTAPRCFPNLGVKCWFSWLWLDCSYLVTSANLKLFAYPDGQAYNFREFPMKRQLASGWWPWRPTAVALEH